MFFHSPALNIRFSVFLLLQILFFYMVLLMWDIFYKAFGNFFSTRWYAVISTVQFTPQLRC